MQSVVDHFFTTRRRRFVLMARASSLECQDNVSPRSLDFSL